MIEKRQFGMGGFHGRADLAEACRSKMVVCCCLEAYDSYLTMIDINWH